MQQAKKPLAIALIGPTASGKTALSLEIARYLPVEMISVDSALVYRGMDIGTAKPDQATQLQIPHHLIDTITPMESYSAAQFRNDCVKLIQDIHKRGRIPLLVGGTMLYIQALLKGLDDLPKANESIRLAIEEKARELGWPALHQELSLIDPITSARLSENDSQRIQRALEVFEITGRPMSALLNKKKNHALPCDLYCIGLTVENRAQLHHQITERLAIMFEKGFLDEVRKIRRQYSQLDLSYPSMRCVGYRQVWQYLDGSIDWQQCQNKALYATRQLCKRQLTWLRSMDIDLKIDAFNPKIEEILKQTIQQLKIAYQIG